MDQYESSSHSKWECKYHVVFIPEVLKKTLYSDRGDIGEVFAGWQRRRKVGSRKGTSCRIECTCLIRFTEVRGVGSGGYIKGKSAIHLACVYGEKQRNFVEQHFRREGTSYRQSGGIGDDPCVHPPPEHEDQRYDQLNLLR